MANRTESENKLLDYLVTDCITYSLSEEQALEFIRIKFGKAISAPAYYERKKKLESDDQAPIWLSYQTRVGFVLAHKQHIEDIARIRNDTMNKLFWEMNKENRNEELILKLKDDLRLSVKMLSELNIGLPVISSIKAQIDEVDAKEKELFQR